MTWSYNLALAAARDRVRLRVGDTDTDLQLLQDEEIDHLLADNGSDVLATSIAAARAILAKYAGRPDIQSSGEDSVNWGQLRFKMRELIEQLERSRRRRARPFTGGASLADTRARDANTDVPRAAFDEDGPGE